MRVLGVAIHKPDTRDVLALLLSNTVVFAILIGIDRMINKHVDLTFIGLIFTIMIWYRLSELMGLNLKRAGWKGLVIQVICAVLIVIGYGVATIH
ncbi:hypothetical protein KDX16_15505 [Burkholderia vietnamiensis]|jgi:hypothetical protein|uniref:Uncharacterized protein n=2 Tax=Burkholderia cepacia complex TaxID=87882 RepID=A0A228HLF9_9BURK|nr:MULTISPECIES: hypothetical protein [Burkholderia]HDR9758695.1 hypothetical protein [Burkholderia cepacia ATCC 25416]MBR7917229.1 hypothetical protein [Burkholderia vietnamiensis]MBR8054767.1 hypothetical protein [Burkholderia vietnamiensis]MDN7570563.1 hypothetical protein [Burkholderia contaminans]OXI31056.1 hypothetical protein CFB84_42400 [Burkholderia aenigmatica]